jgi:PhzF family phenazine biosynthesis protein
MIGPVDLPIYQVDAFASRVLEGNPAAIVPLREWLPAERMQAIAAENNLSETAFLVGGDGAYGIRWFTPAVEVDLCGHATIAAAFLVSTILEPGRGRVVFRSAKHGDLAVEREGDLFHMDFPSRPAAPVAPPEGIERALGVRPEEVLAGPSLLAVLRDEAAVRAVRPDFRWVEALPWHGLVVTAPGSDRDFVSRYFVPQSGIDEDPVTGSTHCTLVPYWAARLCKDTLGARQVSRRGGELYLERRGDRVRIGGRAVLYLEGRIRV